MIAYHFPPFAVGTGIQRTLGFARHLPAFGWEPLILTAHPRAYEYRNNEHLRLPRPMVVEPAFALDSARQLSVMGRYPAFAARPDRWISWWLGAVPKGLAMIRKYRPDAIWSTYPIATAHKIACTLQRLSGLPWVADFRDPMAQDGYPADAQTWKSFKRIEEATLCRASRAVFVTEGAARMYRERYQDVAKHRIDVIENGYEEDAFAELACEDVPRTPLNAGKLTLLHSGVVYPSERDPTQLFAALERLRKEAPQAAEKLRIRLRAPGHESLLRSMIDACGIGDLVELAPSIPYRSALEEMLRADGLLVLQASNCNEQVPAKVYEYLRSERPIVALTDPAGETATLLRRAGVHTIAPLDSAGQICALLCRFIEQAGESSAPDRAFRRSGSRLARTEQFARILDDCLPAALH